MSPADLNWHGELAGRCECSLQSRAAAAVSAENAAGCADDLMERMLEDAIRSENGGSVEVLTSEPNTTGMWLVGACWMLLDL